MPLACKLCIATKGLKGSEIGSLPNTYEELFEHVEREHHVPIVREGETAAEAYDRLLLKYPEARDPKTCKCPACTAARARRAAEAT